MKKPLLFRFTNLLPQTCLNGERVQSSNGLLMLSFKVGDQYLYICSALTPIVIELDIATGEVLFEWSSLEHVDPDGNSQKLRLFDKS